MSIYLITHNTFKTVLLNIYVLYVHEIWTGNLKHYCLHFLFYTFIRYSSQNIRFLPYWYFIREFGQVEHSRNATVLLQQVHQSWMMQSQNGFANKGNINNKGGSQECKLFGGGTHQHGPPVHKCVAYSCVKSTMSGQ